MKVFVLYDKSGIHSGRVLGAYLIKKLTGKVEVHRGRPPRLEQMLAKGHKFNYIINVGWYKDFRAGGAVVLNAPGSIALSSNKKNARIKFQKEKVPAPNLWIGYSSITAKDLPVIGRTTHHTKGKGLWICKTLTDVKNATAKGATHFLKLIPNTREFRVHVMSTKPDMKGIKADDLKVIKLSEKLPNPNAQTDAIVKNHENGWIFGYPKNNKDPYISKIRAIAKQALLPFGLHWGAVDIMLSADTGDAYVLEINSTPCLTDDSANTLDKYATAICELIGVIPARERPKKPASTEILTPKPAPKKTPAKKPNSKFASFLKRNKF